MAVKLNSSSGGSVTLQEPTTASNYTLTVPAQTSTLATTVDAGNYYAFKNRIINGNMAIDQRNAGASVSINGTTSYVTDRFKITTSGGGVISASRSTTAPTGFVNSLSNTVSTADSSIASSDLYVIDQVIEGFNTADLGFGTASASTVTLSFWVRSSVTGTYGVRICNGSFNRTYVSTYVINSANTWEQKTVTIAGDTTGTWATDNSGGIAVSWDLGSGTNWNGTANSWQAGNYLRTSGCVNWIATNGATFYITGVQLEKGTVATSFDYRPYGTELALCQRYFELVNATFSGYTGGGNNAANTALFTVTKRAVPTMTWLGGVAQINFSQASAPGIYQTATVRNFYPFRTATGTGQDSRWEDAYSASAEL